MSQAHSRVQCLSTRKGIASNIEEGKVYLLDLLSVWMDPDGDAYGQLYTEGLTPLGQFRLHHFKTIM